MTCLGLGRPGSAWGLAQKSKGFTQAKQHVIQKFDVSLAQSHDLFFGRLSSACLDRRTLDGGWAQEVGVSHERGVYSQNKVLFCGGKTQVSEKVKTGLHK